MVSKEMGGGGGARAQTEGMRAGEEEDVADLEESGKEQLCTRAYIVPVGGRV